jgi:hypothetical protein
MTPSVTIARVWNNVKTPRAALNISLQAVLFVGAMLVVSGALSLQASVTRNTSTQQIAHETKLIGALCSLQAENQASDLDFAQNLRSVVEHNAKQLPPRVAAGMKRVLTRHIDTIESHPSCVERIQQLSSSP